MFRLEEVKHFNENLVEKTKVFHNLIETGYRKTILEKTN
jgi:hypothetical protein